MNEPRSREPEELAADVVVIGAGAGGLAAAVAAREEGADVVLLEKARAAGGNGAIAGAIFAAESHLQKRLKIDARRDELFQAAMRYAHWTLDPDLVRAFIDRSGDTVRWLEERGVKFTDVAHFLPNQVPRLFHMAEGHGSGFIRPLLAQCERLGVRLLYRTPAKKILTGEGGRVIGVVASARDRDFTVAAKAAVISTGGYAGNRRMLKKYYSDYTDDLYSVGIPHQGDGIRMAQEAGAAMEGLGHLHLRGPHFRGPIEVVVVAKEPETIWLNKRGRRFVDETITYNWPEGANALNRQPDKISYTLFDEALRRWWAEEGITKGYGPCPAGSKMTGLEPKIQKGVAKGQARVAGSLEEVADWMGAERTVLAATVDEYNRFCDRRRDERFVKDPKYLVPLRTPPYYALKCYQGFLGTLGGIKINHRMEVLRPEGEPIPGLYAGGNDTGGWEGPTYNLLLSGNAFAFALNSGRIAAENAVGFLRRTP